MPDIAELLAQLKRLLPQLQDGTIYAIEYGDPSTIGGPLSLLRIRSVPTPSGPQYCFKFITHGAEGSGIYVDNDLELLHQRALIYVDRYHRPTRWETLTDRYQATHSSIPTDAVSFFAVPHETFKKR